MEGLGSAPLTVQAQALSVDDVDPNGLLIHPIFFPYTPTDSVKLQRIFELDDRFAADRREWNAPGRLIPGSTLKIDNLEMVPIESYFGIDEREMQAVLEQTGGVGETYKQVIAKSVPARVNSLVGANFRRVELDAMEAWSKGTITAKNAQNGTTQTLGIGIDSSRIQTAGTAWNDAGTNAYNDLMTWLRDGESVVGPIAAVHLRQATLNAIQADAPNPIPGAQTALKPSRRLIEQVITDELGHEFSFVVNERSVDVFNDGGTAVTRTKIWPAQYVAAIPAGRQIGRTYRAPVLRAAQLAAEFPDAGIDQQGMVVYFDEQNSGKSALVQCQANWLPLPEERFVWTINAGV